MRGIRCEGTALSPGCAREGVSALLDTSGRGMLGRGRACGPANIKRTLGG